MYEGNWKTFTFRGPQETLTAVRSRGGSRWLRTAIDEKISAEREEAELAAATAEETATNRKAAAARKTKRNGRVDKRKTRR